MALVSEKTSLEKLLSQIKTLPKAGLHQLSTLISTTKQTAPHQDLFNITKDGLLVFDQNSAKLLDINQHALEMFGYTRKEALQLGPRLLDGTDSAQQPFEAREKIKQTQGEQSTLFEGHVKNKNDNLFWIELRLQNRLLDGENRTIAIVEDITLRKQAEQALKSQRDRFEYILEGMNVGTWEWNVQTGETIFNERWADIIGYTLEAISPTTIDTWITYSHPEDLQHSNDALQAHFKGETDYYNIECRMKHKDGHWIWVLDRGKVVSWTNDGQPLWMYGSHQDITLQKNREIDALAEEEKYKSILQTAVDGFWLSDLQGRLLEVNDSYCRMSGYSKEELLSMYIPEVEGNMGPAEVAAKIDGVLKNGHDRFETRHRHKNGKLYHVEVSVQYLAIDGGKLVTFLRDINVLKEAEEEKKILQGQLLQAQKMESIGRLAGGVAHDFNNMLGVMFGYAELALEDTGPDQPQYSALCEIKEAAQRSADITRQLLAFARRETINPQVLDLNTTISDMLNMIQRLIGENILLTWLPGEHIWPVEIDPSQLNQVLINLCINARDAIEGTGKLTVETDMIQIDEDFCQNNLGFVPGEFVLLSVSDDGCGMDKETLQMIFEPFYTTKSMDKGTGLGLATVYGIVKQNNGFINVYSEPAKGTTINIYLRRAKQPGKPPLKKAPVPTDRRGIETILVVEDERAILKMVVKMLEHLGYHVLSAATPGQAIALYQQHTEEIHLLLSDVVMPEMNGRELLGELLSIEPQLKHLFMSGYTANVIAHHGILDEGVNYIKKPFSKQELADKIREALETSAKPD